MPKNVIKKRIFIFLAISVIAFLVVLSLSLYTKANLASLIDAPIDEVKVDTPDFLDSQLSEEQPDLPASKQEKTERQVDPPATIPAPQVSVGEQLDDIAEKLDVINKQVLELKVLHQVEPEAEPKEDENPEDEREEEPDQNPEDIVPSEEQEKSYPRIVILEGQSVPAGDRFVKLFNPNNFDVDLTGWYLQRKTKTAESWSSFVSSTNFEGKVVSANGHFLVSNSRLLADIFMDLTLTSGNSLALKNPNREIVDQMILPEYTAPSSGGGGSPSEVDYARILISEVQVLPIGKRFVELFNPNNFDVDLTGWYLQRKTKADGSFTSFVSSTNFENKTIPANGYFLISRELENSDILLNIALNDNDTLALKNPKKDLVGEVSWQESPFENKSLGKVFDEQAQNYADTGWEIQTPTPKEKNTALVEPPPDPTDTTPPEVNFLLSLIQDSLDFTVNFEITDPMGVVSPSGVGSYIFRWQENGLDWQEDEAQNVDGAPEVYDGARDFNAENSKTYLIQINATDVLGNASGWLPETSIMTTVSAVNQENILINEIQLSPIAQRFVELFNPNNFDVDLMGWYLQRKTKTAESWSSFVSSTNFENKTIPANGYFLISRELENSDILLDITLSNNNSLALKNADREIIDKVGWGEAQDCEGSCAQNPVEEQSIKRSLGADTNDNSVDFLIFETPTPGTE
ncbi:MAG: lamin tail domain-containing protein [Candidatus Staskawiczbacteria bacterium]|nr:lamin tail domain-containing protein [Candidatus Staskawiczbacteria bacterium]